MIGRTNAGAGGGLSLKDALLHVNAPLGSIVNFIKNNIIIKTLEPGKAIPNIDGKTADYYFSISAQNYGTWTVTSTFDEDDIETEDVQIVASQQYDVIITYAYYVIKNGVYQHNHEFLKGGTYSSGSGFTITNGDGYKQMSTVGGASAYCDVDFTDYSTLEIDLAFHFENSWFYAGVATGSGWSDHSPNSYLTYESWNVSFDRRIKSFDTSNIIGIREIKFQYYSSHVLTIYNMRLRKGVIG